MMQKQLNLTVPDGAIEFVISKIIMLLKCWPDKPDIVDQTAGSDGLLWFLATGYSASKLMNKSRLVGYILEHHLELDVSNYRRSRESFYKALSNLLFSVNNKTVEFYSFVLPIQKRMEEIKFNITSPNLQLNEKAHILLRQILSDLRGFISAINNKDRGYLFIFDWFYHETGYYEWLLKLLSQSVQYQLTTEDVWGIILFADEFNNNTRRRIVFPETSADGLKLFRTTAEMLIQYAHFIMSSRHSNELDDRYKSIKFFLRCFERCLTGGYANFGIFEIYKDPIVENLLNICGNILFTINHAHLEVNF